MATSYLNLTNKLLRRLNETVIPQSDFGSVVGVKAMAKDVIDEACQEITEAEIEWPFNAASTTQLLVVGQEAYSFPANFVKPNWDSFHIVGSTPLAIYGHPLEFISRDIWLKRLKADDDHSASDGLAVPLFVFESQGEGFAVSPSPDEAYTVSYDYWAGHTTLTTYDSTPTIPSRWDEVIIQGALYHFYMFRDNSEQAQLAEQKFKARLKQMRTALINKEDRIRSTLIVRDNNSYTRTFTLGITE